MTVKKKQKRASTTKNTSDHRKDFLINWSATDYSTSKHWWWYVGFLTVAIWLILLLALLSQWLMAACALTATVAMLVVYKKRAPKTIHYRLNGYKLVVDKNIFILDDYRAVTAEPLVLMDGDQCEANIWLIPKRTLTLPVRVILPENEYQTDIILDLIGNILPFDDAKGYWRAQNIIDRIARWLRLV